MVLIPKIGSCAYQVQGGTKIAKTCENVRKNAKISKNDANSKKTLTNKKLKKSKKSAKKCEKKDAKIPNLRKCAKMQKRRKKIYTPSFWPASVVDQLLFNTRNITKI